MPRMFKLDNRLYSCARMVSPGCRVVDVGSDHAYLPIWLVVNKIAISAVASDINDGPVNKAAQNIKRYKLEDKIQVVKSDGLGVIDYHNIDEIIIAGMGGKLISKIISGAPWIKKFRKRLILQPMSSEKYLREYLCENGFFIENEVASLSKKRIYTCMSVLYTGKKSKTSIEYPYIGKIDSNIDTYSIEYMKRQVLNVKNSIKNNKDIENKSIIISRIQNIINNF